MRKTVLSIIVVLGLALILGGVSLLVRPDWLGIPGGILLLLGAAFIAIAGLGDKLKGWRDLLFPPEERKDEPPLPKPEPLRTQEMTESEEGEQIIRGKAGVQKQKMKDSPRGKQTME